MLHFNHDRGIGPIVPNRSGPILYPRRGPGSAQYEYSITTLTLRLTSEVLRTFYAETYLLEAALFEHLFSDVSVLMVTEEPVHLGVVDHLGVFLAHGRRVVLVPVQHIVVKENHYVALAVSML